MSFIKMQNNLDVVGELSGTLQGLDQATRSPDYMESLIRAAHNKAAKEFDNFAAATGAAGVIPHMFEFGTAGVTEGPSRFRPTDKAAQLWVHVLEGTGGNQEVSFTFRPAVARNPRPTTRSTGVPSKYLRRLSNRKYVFYNKAFVMESGQEVTIDARNGDYLFIPFRHEPPRGKYENTRGYMMWNARKYGPVKAMPGRDVRGNFTKLWGTWWASTGGPMMEGDMVKDFNVDMDRILAASAARAATQRPQPASTVKVEATAAKAETSTISKVRAAVRARLAKMRNKQ